jgi:ribosomal protein S1
MFQTNKILNHNRRKNMPARKKQEEPTADAAVELQKSGLEETQGETAEAEAVCLPAPNPADEPPLELNSPDGEPEEPVISPPSDEVTESKKSFYDLDLNKLDRNLSPEEMSEWNSIYASYRARSILTGTVIGSDENTFEVSGGEDGSGVRIMRSLTVIDYRVKVLIPESELWTPGAERPGFVFMNMVGSVVDYIILDVDREKDCAIGSRRKATAARRALFARTEHREGEKLRCRIVAVGPKLCTAECNGFDLQLTQRDLTYTATPDLRERYRPGMELDCILKRYDKDAGLLEISAKHARPNPFDGAETRHPIGSRRQAVISGKYRGGVFCTLPDGTVCHCLHTLRHTDADFSEGDTVIIGIREFNYERRQIFGRILTKW